MSQSFLPPPLCSSSPKNGASLPSRAERKPDKSQEAAKGFEAMFLNQVVGLMFPKSGLFGGGMAEDMMRPLWIEEIAKKMSEQGVGISDLVQKSLLSLQEMKG
jgi:Rod binding domain-containing protein